MRILLNKQWVKVFSILRSPSWSILRSLVLIFLLLLHLFMSWLLIFNWYELLPLFLGRLRLDLLLLRWLLFGRGLLLPFGLAMSCVAAVSWRLVRFNVTGILLTFAILALGFSAYTVVALDVITRFDSLGVHLAVGAHL